MTKFDTGYVNLPAFYRHNNGDLDPVMILDYDGKGNAWIRWKDGFVNMMPCTRLKLLKEE